MTLLVPPHPHPSSLRRLAAPVTNCTELAARFDAIRTDLGGVATKARPYTVTLACGGGADAFAGCQRLSTGFYAGLLTIQADAACATGAARPRLVVAALPWPDSLTPFLHHSGVRRGARASVDAHPNVGGTLLLLHGLRAPCDPRLLTSLASHAAHLSIQRPPLARQESIREATWSFRALSSTVPTSRRR